MLSAITKNQIKELLVNNFDLSKIILFGSQSRGTADSKSDVDLLIISDEVKDKFSAMTSIRKVLLGLNYGFDVIILSSSEFERDKKFPGTIARYAEAEGTLLYER
ncbi:MAG: nucleotidyltransferase domain-containing protein [Ignavibacteriales bacterium]|nr:nucleotidyltransferase domain-containing protein [Ignavibacteriales bacterium]MCF8438556.1 nucleotidyltransferase domain-containing protein [Ignavibacteriales bacterium]